MHEDEQRAQRHEDRKLVEALLGRDYSDVTNSLLLCRLLFHLEGLLLLVSTRLAFSSCVTALFYLVCFVYLVLIV
jgi:hypothetical protein